MSEGPNAQEKKITWDDFEQKDHLISQVPAPGYQDNLERFVFYCDPPIVSYHITYGNKGGTNQLEEA